jgi:hypothetical protein
MNIVLSANAATYTEAIKQAQRQLDKLAGGAKTARQEFDGVLGKEQKLYEREEELAESYSGSLIAGNTPTPTNGCEKNLPPSATTIIFPNQNGSFTTSYPHTVLMVNGRPMLRLIEVSPGVITPLMDIRDPDGKIIVRFDGSGFVVGRRLSVQRPDLSTLVVDDEYGEQALLGRVHTIG